MIESGNPNAVAGFELVASDEFDRIFYTRDAVVLRTEYDKTLMNIVVVFKKSEIDFGFCEYLFTEGSVSNCCSHLEIAYRALNCDKKVNETAISKMLNANPALVDARRYYAATYDFCASHFGEEYIRHIWSYDSLASS